MQVEISFAEFLIAGGNFVYAEVRKVAVVSATVTINPSEGYFEGYDGATNLENAGLQNTDYKLGFLPKVQANKGYAFTGWKVTNEAGDVIYTLDTSASEIAFPYGVAGHYTVEAKVQANKGYAFTGWKVTNEAGDVIYTLDTSASEIAFPYGVAGHYTVEAVFEKVPVEVSATVTINPVKGSFEGYDGATNLENAGLQDTDYTLGFLPVFEKVPVEVSATVTINPVKGSFEGYDGATNLENAGLQDTDYTLGFLPEVKANKGYVWTGWKVTNGAGEVIYTLRYFCNRDRIPVWCGRTLHSRSCI